VIGSDCPKEIGQFVNCMQRMHFSAFSKAKMFGKSVQDKMKFGKTIKIFLIDGDPNGRMTVELSNWSGKAYKIPRVNIKDCTDRNDLQGTGVYLLLGKMKMTRTWFTLAKPNQY